jgi:hypothetical protein
MAEAMPAIVVVAVSSTVTWMLPPTKAAVGVVPWAAASTIETVTPLAVVPVVSEVMVITSLPPALPPVRLSVTPVGVLRLVSVAPT